MRAFFCAWRKRLREPAVVWQSQSAALAISVEAQSAVPWIAFVLIAAWYVFFPSPVALMSAVTLGGVTLASFVWARSMARGVRAQRNLRFAAMQVGDELEEQVSLTNKTILPVLWAEFSDHSNIPGYTISSARAADPVSSISWRVHTISSRRGVFQLGPWELRMGDPFGIFLVRQVYRERQDILVYPPLAALPQRLLPHHGALGDHRPLNQPLQAETNVSSSVRAYSAGDPLRRVHWRTTARRGGLFVKVFAPEAASNVWLLPDFDASVHCQRPQEPVLPGEGERPADGPAPLHSSLETMVTVTASLAAELLDQRLAVGLLAASEHPSLVMPRQGPAHLWSILQALAPLEAVEGQPLEDLLGRAQALVNANDLLIVVTPSTRSEWIAPLTRLAQRRGGTSRAEVVLLEPSAYGGPRHIGTILSALATHGLAANVLDEEDVRPISGFYGELSRWEFKVVGHGKAVASKTPRLTQIFAGVPDQGQSGR